MTLQTTLTSRERVIRMFNREDQDRIPRGDSFWTDTLERWAKEGFDDKVTPILDWIETDFQSLGFYWPQPFPGRNEIIEEDEETQVTINGFGEKCRNWKNKMGTPEHLGWECQTREEWERIYKPALIKNAEHGALLNMDDIKASYAKGLEKNRWNYIAGVEAFESTRKLLGDEGSLMAMALDPQWIIDISNVVTDLNIKIFQRLLDAGIELDGLWIYGDMAYRNATVCSPTMYRELIWPDHKRIADFAHQNDLKLIFHTDGDINSVMDMYVEAGFDLLQPLEAKANVDVRTLAPKYGDKLGFFGNIDTMIMATGDRDKIKHEIKTKLEAGKACKGYAYHSDHSVPPTVSWESYQYVIELVNQYGRYE